MQLAMFWYGCSAEERDAYANVLVFLVLSGEDTVAQAALEVIVHEIVKSPTTILPRGIEGDEEFRDAVAVAVIEKLRAVGQLEDQGEPQPWRRLVSYDRSCDADSGKFRAWLKVIAYRTAIDLLRRHPLSVGSRSDRRWVRRVPLEQWDAGAQAVEAWRSETSLPGRLDAVRTLTDAVDWVGTLPAADREILCLRVDHGLGHREIADRVGSTAEAVRKRIARLRTRLKAHLSS
ncbi:MAG: hypothetical protein Tsb0020_49460 [Haliangiales bacterium]